MTLMAGKKGLIFGVSNKRSIGYGIANALFQAGAEIGFTYAGDVMEGRVRPIAESMNAPFVMDCDVTDEAAIKAVFDKAKETFGTIDFVVHSVAFANRDDLLGNFSDTSIDGWNLALGVSAYSLLPITKYASQLMPNGGSIITLSYLGGERSVPNYNVMGVAKAALECSVRYLAAEYGSQDIRVNAISAGPIRTLAAKGISGFDMIWKVNELRSPMKKNVSIDDVGNSGLYLCSDLSKGVTGETHHVDAGFHSVAVSKEDVKLIGKEITE